MLREINGSVINLQPVVLQTNGVTVYVVERKHYSNSFDSGIATQKNKNIEEIERMPESAAATLDTMSIF